MTRAFIAFLFMVMALAFAPSALAYTPPPMTAHVTDAAHKLTEPERIAIDRKLEDYRLRTTNEIAVFLPATLDGETIEDVANATARAWRLGASGDKNGLLLVIAPVERRARIEVAQGNQGALTDIQTSDIIRSKIKPRLTPGSENYRAAVDDATDAIIQALDKDLASSGGPAPAKRHPASGSDVAFGLIFFLFMIAVPIIFMIVIVRALARAFSSNGRSAGAGWASGSSWSNDSSWSSGSSGGGSDWGGGGGGGGGDSGFSGGGGGGFDGGGSSDSF
jgi:uncharacterized protein